MSMMRFSCNVCHRFASPNLKGVMRHIGSVHSFEPGFNVTCGISGCARSYQNFRSFQRHIARRHSAALNVVAESNNEEDSTFYDAFNDSPQSPSLPSNDPIKPNLKRSAALFLLKTKEISGVTQRALNDVIGGVTQLLDAHCGDFSIRPFEGLESEYLQQKYFEEELHLLVCSLLYELCKLQTS